MARRKWAKKEIEDYRKEHGAFLYCNKQDSNFLVSKAFGIGFTVNWANPIVWILILAIIALIIIRKF